jgi:hypothetical protein
MAACALNAVPPEFNHALILLARPAWVIVNLEPLISFIALVDPPFVVYPKLAVGPEKSDPYE